ncbi:MAG: polyprenyl synthetase family protein [Aquificaceae bacterium]|nr:polyprenyl synthetase family protein [Aquificaceae bacterium]
MERLELWKRRIEERLRELLKPFEPHILYQAMSYYLFQEGKRIRPLLLCAVCHALGGDVEDGVTVGCAVEMVHNYSLVHDDLPALDNDTLRRGKPTCHVVFGEDIAILAGDALLTCAFEVLSEVSNFKSLSEKELLFLTKELAVRSGYRGMVGGQVLDIRNLSNHEEISLKKTAQLFSLCFLAGGIIAKRYDLTEALEKLGLEFGLIFQMMDDYKDKDGFYNLYGEELLKRLKSLREEYQAHLKGVGLLTEELKELLNMVSCS